jgi:heat shock protein HslJ
VKVAGTPPAAAPLAAFTATGHEPGWRLDIVGGRITLAADYGATRITLPSPPGTAVPNGRTYAGKTGHHHVTVTILDGPCADAATGMPHPNTVEVVLDGRTLRGCGGDPASLLRATAWVVESLDGAAVRGGAPITLRFGDDGRVAGSASCNSFNARYAITGDGLEISQAAATMKACLPDVMTQEGAFLNALGAVERFETTAAGGLVLHAANSRRIVARRERALPVPQAASPPAPRFSDRVWKVSESSAVALGSLYVFLSEGTLVMTSPGSRPSLGSWTYDGRSLTMTEDGVRHRVDILEQGDARLRLRSHNPGGAVDVTLVPAEGGETRK